MTNILCTIPIIIPHGFHFSYLGIINVIGDIIPIQAGHAWRINMVVTFPGYCFHQIIDLLVEQGVHFQVFLNFLFVHVSGDELSFGWHIHTIKTRRFHRGACHGKLHFFGAEVFQHTNDLAAGVSADDAIIHDEHFFFADF